MGLSLFCACAVLLTVGALESFTLLIVSTGLDIWMDYASVIDANLDVC
uniref:Uncharacterized protein n=1 Tax=Arundo donax TaxID=35708 RepID=A0A0A9BJL6_ARUDO